MTEPSRENQVPAVLQLLLQNRYWLIHHRTTFIFSDNKIRCLLVKPVTSGHQHNSFDTCFNLFTVPQQSIEINLTVHNVLTFLNIMTNLIVAIVFL